MSEESGEIAIEGMGGKLRARGYRLLDLVCLVSLGLMIYCSIVLFTHTAEAKDDNKGVAAALKESNAEVARALREVSKENTELFKAMAAEQRKMTQAITEGNCLADPVMKTRQDAREFCKRMARDR